MEEELSDKLRKYTLTRGENLLLKDVITSASTVSLRWDLAEYNELRAKNLNPALLGAQVVRQYFISNPVPNGHPIISIDDRITTAKAVTVSLSLRIDADPVIVDNLPPEAPYVFAPKMPTKTEQLKKFYDAVIEGYISDAQEGIPWRGKDLLRGADIECRLLGESEQEVRPRRKKILSMQMQASIDDLDARTWDTIDRTVEDFALDIINTARKNKLDAEHAYQHISNEMTYQKLISYVRALGFVKLLHRHPEKVKELRSNASYFPHFLFCAKKPTTKDILMLIASEIVPLFSERVINVSAACYDTTLRIEGTYGKKDCGEYYIPKSAHMVFRDDANPEQVRPLFTAETKRDLYAVIGSYLQIAALMATKNDRNPKNLHSHSDIFLILSDYKNLRRALEKHACNSALYHFKKGSPFNETLLRCARVKAVRHDEHLEVQMFDSHFSMTNESKFMSTTTRLPYLASVMHEVYRAALALTSPEAISLSQNQPDDGTSLLLPSA